MCILHVTVLNQRQIQIRQTSKMDVFAKIAHGFSLLTIFGKSSISDVRLGTEYPSVDSNPLLTFSKSQAADLLAN